ncbi:hypothetical protein CHUAL_012333 [Chamberlinius hualienensis]
MIGFVLFGSLLIVCYGVNTRSNSRLFKRSAVQNIDNFNNVIMNLNGNEFDIRHCAVHCNLNSNCLAFNYTNYPNNTSNCQLLSVKNQLPAVQLTDASGLSYEYYEEDCTRFIPRNRCLYGGTPKWVNNTSCTLTDCICLPRHRGDRCQKNCTFQKNPGKDIVDGAFDIYYYFEPLVEKCLDNCTSLTAMAGLTFFLSLLVIGYSIKVNSSFRLFTRSTIQNLNTTNNVIKNLIGKEFDLLYCAIYCQSNSNCLAFNFTTHPNKTSNCQLLNVKNSYSLARQTSNFNLSYYEEDCSRFVPEHYCLYGGTPTWANNTSCKLANCTCLPRHRGDRCQQNCTFQKNPGKDINNVSYDIYVYVEPNIEKCLDTCSSIQACHSVMYNSKETKCILKTKSYFDQLSIIDTDYSNILCSIQCK